MNEILKNKKNSNEKNYNCYNNNTETIDNQSHNNKIQLPMGYNYYYARNKLNNDINISTTNNKKKSKNNNTQNKF